MLRNVNWAGLAICALGIGVNLAYAVVGAISWTAVYWQALLYSALALGSVTWEVIGLHRVVHLHREGRPVATVVCAVGLALAFVVSVSFELNFIAGMQERNVAVGESRAGSRESLQRERAQLQSTIDKAGASRPAAAVEGDLIAVKGHARWTSSKGCTDVTAPESQALCQRYGALLAERGAAEGVAAAQTRIREINGLLTPLATAGTADARGDYLGRITGAASIDVRVTIAMIMIVFAHVASMGAPFCFADPRGGGNMGGAVAFAASAAPQSAAQVMPPAALLVDDTGDDIDPDEAQAAWEMDQAVLLSGIRAEAAPEPDEIELPLDVTARRARLAVQRFLNEACYFRVGGADGVGEFSETGAAMWNCYAMWYGDMEMADRHLDGDSGPITRLSPDAFGQTLRAIVEQRGGYKKLTKRGNVYYGPRIRPSYAHRLANAADAEQSKPAATAPQRRLGAFVRDSREEMGEIGKAVGNA